MSRKKRTSPNRAAPGISNNASPNVEPTNAAKDLVTRLGNWMSNNLALTLSLMAALTILLKVYSVSHYNTATVLIVMKYQAAVGLFAILVGALPYVVLGFFISAVFSLGDAIREREPLASPMLVTAIGAVPFIFLAPFAVTLVAVVCVPGYLLTIGAIRHWKRVASKLKPWTRFRGSLQNPGNIPEGKSGSNNPASRRDTPSLGGIVLACIATTWMLIAVVDQPWIPAERVILEDTSVRVGYLLGVDSPGEQYVYLDDHSRMVFTLPGGKISRREFCTPETISFRKPLVASLWSSGDSYPKC